MNADEMWKRFIEHLNKVEPLKQGHKNFLGSEAHYKKIFMEANERRKAEMEKR